MAFVLIPHTVFHCYSRRIISFRSEITPSNLSRFMSFFSAWLFLQTNSNRNLRHFCCLQQKKKHSTKQFCLFVWWENIGMRWKSYRKFIRIRESSVRVVWAMAPSIVRYFHSADLWKSKALDCGEIALRIHFENYNEWQVANHAQHNFQHLDWYDYFECLRYTRKVLLSISNESFLSKQKSVHYSDN